MQYQIFSLASSFTRPNDTTQYSQNDLVANNTASGSVVPLSWSIPGGNGAKLYGVQLTKSTATVTNATFKLYLYAQSPTVANGDNGAFSSSGSTFLGTVTLDATSPTFTDKASAFGAISTPIVIQNDTTRRVYGLLQNTTATGYVPGAQEVFTVTLTGEANF